MDATTVTISVFIITHISVTIWWASRVSTLLTVVQQNLVDLVKEFKEARNIFATKEALAEKFMLQTKEIETIWKNIENIREKMGD